MGSAIFTMDASRMTRNCAKARTVRASHRLVLRGADATDAGVGVDVVIVVFLSTGESV
jgi:hypothetical protein